MTGIILADLAEARQFQRFLLWLFDLPKECQRVTGGIHAPHDPPPLDFHRVAIGWGTRYVDFVKHPTDARYAVRLTQEMLDAYNAKKGLLTPAQRTWLQTRVTSAASLPAEWRPSGVEDESTEVPPDTGVILP